jgi:hypothetical protein
MVKKLVLIFSVFFCLIILLNTNPGLLANQVPKINPQTRTAIVDKVSDILAKNYLFPEKGEKMKYLLREKLKNGDYDKITDMKKLAEQLTSDLQDFSKDRHLVVVYSPGKVAELKKEESHPGEEESEEIRKIRYEKQRRNNFGFRKLEILDGNIGYLDLRSFQDTEDAAPTAIGAINFLSNADAIIIDLRNNHGGTASMYLLLCSYFFSSETVHLGDIYSRCTNTTRQFRTLPYVPGKRMPNVDLYILTSRRTFSAAEEFTYDLKHLNRATIIGESTGGGAHMVTRMIVNDYIYMFVPFTGAINPRTKTNWEGVGVKPHISVPEEKAFQVAYLTALKKCAEKSTYKKWTEYLQSIIRDLDKKITE